MEKEYTITVRFVTDHRVGKCWFEEKLHNGQWAMIPETVTISEANSRHSLEKVIEARRQNRLMISRSFKDEETFTV